MGDLDSIHAALAELQRATGRIEGTLTSVASSIVARESEHNALEKRVTHLEGQQAYTAGKSAVVSSIAGGTLGALAAWVGRHLP